MSRIWSVGYGKSAVEKLHSSSYFLNLQASGQYRVQGSNAAEAKEDAIDYFMKQFRVELAPEDLTVEIVQRLI